MNYQHRCRLVDLTADRVIGNFDMVDTAELVRELYLDELINPNEHEVVIIEGD